MKFELQAVVEGLVCHPDNHTDVEVMLRCVSGTCDVDASAPEAKKVRGEMIRLRVKQLAAGKLRIGQELTVSISDRVYGHSVHAM